MEGLTSATSSLGKSAKKGLTAPPHRARLIIHIMSQKALPHKSDYESIYEANAVSAPKVPFMPHQCSSDAAVHSKALSRRNAYNFRGDGSHSISFLLVPI